MQIETLAGQVNKLKDVGKTIMSKKDSEITRLKQEIEGMKSERDTKNKEIEELKILLKVQQQPHANNEPRTENSEATKMEDDHSKQNNEGKSSSQ